MKYVISSFLSFLLLAFVTSCQDNEKSNLTLLSDEIPTDTAWFLDKVLFQRTILSSLSLSIRQWVNCILILDSIANQLSFKIGHRLSRDGKVYKKPRVNIN